MRLTAQNKCNNLLLNAKITHFSVKRTLGPKRLKALKPQTFSDFRKRHIFPTKVYFTFFSYLPPLKRYGHFQVRTSLLSWFWTKTSHVKPLTVPQIFDDFRRSVSFRRAVFFSGGPPKSTPNLPCHQAFQNMKFSSKTN